MLLVGIPPTVPRTMAMLAMPEHGQHARGTRSADHERVAEDSQVPCDAFELLREKVVTTTCH